MRRRTARRASGAHRQQLLFGSWRECIDARGSGAGRLRFALGLGPLAEEDGVDADATREVRGEEPLRVELVLDAEQLVVPRVQAAELLGPEDLVLGQVDLAAVARGGVDEPVDGAAAGVDVTRLGMELHVEGVAVFREGDDAVVLLVRAEDGGGGRARRGAADGHHLGHGLAGVLAWEGELDGVAVGPAGEVGRGDGEAGLEAESEEELVVLAAPDAVDDAAGVVVQAVEGADEGLLHLEHEGEDRPEALVQREPEGAVAVEPGVAGIEHPVPLAGVLRGVEPPCGVDHRAADAPAGCGGVHPDDHGVVLLLGVPEPLEEVVGVAGRDPVDVHVGRGDGLELQGDAEEDAEHAEAARGGVEDLVLAVDLEEASVGPEQGEADDLLGEAAVLPGVLAVHVGADGAGDAGGGLGGAGGEVEQVVMDVAVDVDEAGAALDGDPPGAGIELEDAVHPAHVEQAVAVVEGEVAVGPTGAADADGHPGFTEPGDGREALVLGRRARDEGAGPDGPDEGVEVLPAHAVEWLRGCLGHGWHDDTPGAGGGGPRVRWLGRDRRVRTAMPTGASTSFCRAAWRLGGLRAPAGG